MDGNVISQPRWSSNELEALKAGFAAGLNDSQLGADSGRSFMAVRRKRWELCLFRPHKSGSSRWTAELIAKLRELAEEKFYSGAKIGEMLGFTRGAIIGKCDREGIALHGKIRFRTKVKRIRIRKHQPARFLLKAPKPVMKVLPWKKSEVIPLRVSLMDLQSELQCHQVVDGETSDDRRCAPLYCGHPIWRRSYCFEHYRENHQSVRVNA